MKTSQRHFACSLSKIDHPYMQQHIPTIKIGSLNNWVELKSIDGWRKKISDKKNLTNFNQLRKEVLNSISNFTKIHELPKSSQIQSENIQTNFESEEVIVRELDYYYTIFISWSSTTMSDCTHIRTKTQKDGWNN